MKFPPEEIESRRWQKIADELGNRTAKQVSYDQLEQVHGYTCLLLITTEFPHKLHTNISSQRIS